MKASRKITKILLACFWLLTGSGIIVLMAAAVNSRNHKTCAGYQIKINGQKNGKWFINKDNIIDILTSNRTIPLKNRSLKSFDLHTIESRLRNEAWVKDAELFFDNNGLLQVSIVQREPVARLFTAAGSSFYIDSTGARLPLSENLSVKLPVFTGFPSEARKWKPADRKLIRSISQLSRYLLNDPFWMAQIEQVDITPSREFEMTTTIGNHLVEFGDADDAEKKFRRLMIFYKQVMARSGMDKYERIKVQFDNQVIGVKKTN